MNKVKLKKKKKSKAQSKMSTNWEKCDLKGSLGKGKSERWDRRASNHSIVWDIVVCVCTLTRSLYYIHTLYNTYVYVHYTNTHFTWYTYTTIHTCVFIHIYILTKNLQTHTFTCMGSRTHMATAGVINVTVFPLKMCLPYKPPRCFQEFMQGAHPLKPVGGQEKEKIGKLAIIGSY